MEIAPFRCIRVWNLLTYSSAFSSLLAVFFAARLNVPATGVFIGLSSLLDIFDGKFAALFQRTPVEKKMGVEIDSLTDIIAFGFAPILCLIFLGGGGGWSLPAGCFYLVSALTRLSFYNVISEETENKDFVGVPTTLIGILWTLILLFPQTFRFAGVFFLLFGVLMLLPVKIRRPGLRGLLAVMFLLVVFIALHLIRLVHGE